MINQYKQYFADILKKEIKLPGQDIFQMIEIPPENIPGDFAFPCFLLSKQLHKAPNLIAQELAEKLSSKHFVQFQAIGGYVNAHVKHDDFVKDFFATKHRAMEMQKHGNRDKILIEYMSANPNKPLHIGQARNVCVGDSIRRVYEYFNYPVTSCNYGDDSGVNVGYNIVGHKYYDISLETTKKFDHYCGEIYEKMRKLEEDPIFQKRLSEILLQIEENTDPEIRTLHQKYTKDCAREQLKSCRRMGSYFDLVARETDILHLKFFAQAITILKEQGRVKYADEGDVKGCWILDLSSLPEYQKEEKQYQILIKSDGVATYIAKDIAFAMWKLGYLGKNFGYQQFAEDPRGKTVYTTISDGETGSKHGFGCYDVAITVIDNRQLPPQNIVKSALKLLGHNEDEKKYTPLGYGVVYLTPQTLMKLGYELSEEEKQEKRLPFASRKGRTVSIDAMLDMLHKKAFFETKERNPEKYDGRLDEVAESIAISALRFFLIRGDISKDVVFDIDEVMDMHGETGAYILYTGARLQSILDSVGGFPVTKDLPSLLTHADEFALIKKISTFCDVVVRTKDELAPHLIAKFCFDLCQLINSYYAHVKILADDEKTKHARVYLLQEVSKILKEAMELIGMKFVERM